MDPQKLSAQALVQLCLASQDEAPWQEFVRRFQRTISGTVIKSLRHRPWIYPVPALVDDLTQDTFLKLCANDYRALRDFDFKYENAFYGFLKEVASNVVKDYVRKIENEKHGGHLKEEDLEKATIIVPASGSSPDRKILFDQILRCLQRLSSQPNFKRDWVIFQLYYVDGLTAAAIADRPGIGLGTKGVESTLLRLIRFLKGELGDSRGHHA